MSDQSRLRRLPTLADRFMARRFSAHDRVVHPKTLEQLQAATRNAHRFVLDEDAARRIARVVLTIPDLLVREHQFARAPYDLTWIEFPSWAYWETLTEANPERYRRQRERSDEFASFAQMDTADHTVGYLIDHERINTITGGTVSNPDMDAEVSPLQYRLHTEWPVEDQLAFARSAGCSRMLIDGFLWGATWDRLSQDDRRLLRSTNTVEMIPLNPLHRAHHTWLEAGALATSVSGAMGDLRTIIAILLMLNRPALTRYVNAVPSTRGWLKGKMIPYLSHTTVAISIDPVATLRLIGTPEGDAVERRRHEVRGHFCHDKTARDYMRIAGCIHDWRPTHDDWTPWLHGPSLEVNHWVCAACEGKRWWRSEHERGTAVRGFVVKDGYDVTSL